MDFSSKSNSIAPSAVSMQARMLAITLSAIFASFDLSHVRYVRRGPGSLSRCGSGILLVPNDGEFIAGSLDHCLEGLDRIDNFHDVFAEYREGRV